MGERERADTREILEIGFRICSEPGLCDGALARIASEAQVDSDRILYWYDNLETLLRLAVDAKVKTLLEPVRSCRPSVGPVRQAIQDLAMHSVRLFTSDDYRRLCYLVVRDGTLYPWLTHRHDGVLLAKIQASLARVVRQATEHSPVPLEIRPSGARTFVTRLLRELALPMLLPKQPQPTSLECRRLAARVTDEAMRALYPPGMVMESIVEAIRA